MWKRLCPVGTEGLSAVLALACGSATADDDAGRGVGPARRVSRRGGRGPLPGATEGVSTASSVPFLQVRHQGNQAKSCGTRRRPGKSGQQMHSSRQASTFWFPPFAAWQRILIRTSSSPERWTTCWRRLSSRELHPTLTRTASTLQACVPVAALPFSPPSLGRTCAVPSCTMLSRGRFQSWQRAATTDTPSPCMTKRHRACDHAEMAVTRGKWESEERTTRRNGSPKRP
jgi:hypothetical protein